MRLAPRILIVLLALGAALAVASTWSVFSQVMDEPAHIGAGMEWLARGTYTIEAQHPPLARIAVALGPFLRGVPFVRDQLLATGNRILYHRGDYLANLSAARAGVLPFFLLAVAVVAAWAWRIAGPWPAVAATALFVTLPPVLAHAGLATTDVPAMATIAAALFAFTLWLDRPTTPRSLLLGAALGAALATKLSALGFLPAGVIGILLARAIANVAPGVPPGVDPAGSRSERGASHEADSAHDRDGAASIPASRPPAGRRGPRAKALAIVLATAFVVVWALFRFSFGPLVQPPRIPPPDDRGAAANAIRALARIPVPAPEFFWGVQELGEHDEKGDFAYLCGEVSTEGWASYFPIAIAVKTPIPFLLLALIGAIVAIANARRDPAPLGLLLAALAILAVAMTSSINLGIRHVLPIYPLLAILGATLLRRVHPPSPRREPNPERPETDLPGRGAGGEGPASRMPRGTRRYAGFVVFSALMAWQLWNAVSAHPDHLAWFNEIADDAPEAWLLDSNLDWGQDLLRLEEAVRRRGIDRLALSYFGSAIPQFHRLPNLTFAHPMQPATGWIAISRMNLRGPGLLSTEPLYRWLDGHEPVEVIGASILLFHIEEPTPPPPAEAILLPVLIGPEPIEIAGRAWKTLVVSSWRGDEVLWIGIGGKPAAIKPGTHRPAEFERTALSGLLLVMPETEAPKIHYDLLLRDERTGEMIPLPVIRGAEVPEGAFRIEGFADGARGRSLRLFDLARIPRGRARIRVLRDGRIAQEREIELAQPEETGPYFNEVDLAELALAPADALEITAAAEGMRLWAMVVETEAETGGIRVLAP